MWMDQSAAPLQWRKEGRWTCAVDPLNRSFFGSYSSLVLETLFRDRVQLEQGTQKFAFLAVWKVDLIDPIDLPRPIEFC